MIDSNEEQTDSDPVVASEDRDTPPPPKPRPYARGPRSNRPKEPVLGEPGQCDYAYTIVKTGSGYIPVLLEGVRFGAAQLADPRGIHSKFVSESRTVALARLYRGAEYRTTKNHFGWIKGGKAAWDQG